MAHSKETTAYMVQTRFREGAFNRSSCRLQTALVLADVCIPHFHPQAADAGDEGYRLFPLALQCSLKEL